MRTIQKLYKKEKAKHVEEKSYVVNRTFNSSMGKKTARGVKMVDARLRAEANWFKPWKQITNSKLPCATKKSISQAVIKLLGK